MKKLKLGNYSFSDEELIFIGQRHCAMQGLDCYKYRVDYINNCVIYTGITLFGYDVETSVNFSTLPIYLGK